MRSVSTLPAGHTRERSSEGRAACLHSAPRCVATGRTGDSHKAHSAQATARNQTPVRHEQAPCPCLRSACHRPAPARQRSTRRQCRALLQGHPERHCLASLRVRARARRRRQGHRRARPPGRRGQAVLRAERRGAGSTPPSPLGGGWMRQGAATVGARCRAHGGQVRGTARRQGKPTQEAATRGRRVPHPPTGAGEQPRPWACATEFP